MRRPKDPDARTNAVARYLIGQGSHDTDAYGRRMVLSDEVAFMVVGATSLPGKASIGQLLTEARLDYPNRVPAVVRTVGPEIEQSQITMRLTDWVALTRRSK